MVALSGWDSTLLREETPAEFLELLGVRPAFQGLPEPQEWPLSQQQQEQLPMTGMEDPPVSAAVDQAMADAADGAADGADAAAAAADPGVLNGSGGADAAADAAAAVDASGADSSSAAALLMPHDDPELLWSGRLLAALLSRPPPERRPFISEQLESWIQEQQVREGGAARAIAAAAPPLLPAALTSPCSAALRLEHYPCFGRVLAGGGCGGGTACPAADSVPRGARCWQQVLQPLLCAAGAPCTSAATAAGRRWCTSWAARAAGCAGGDIRTHDAAYDVSA
jgi:hypothetical protein